MRVNDYPKMVESFVDKTVEDDDKDSMKSPTIDDP